LWLHSLKVAQLLRSAACLHTNQSRSYLNHLVFQISGNNLDKSKFYSRRNLEQTEVRECLLSFNAESFVFHFAIQKYKDLNIQNYSFFFCFVYVCETWSLTLSDQIKLRVFENAV